MPFDQHIESYFRFSCNFGDALFWAEYVMPVSFKDLNLAPPLLQAVEALGFENATPVQEEVYPAAIQGGDLMVSSQTGSGKTAAFLLPILQQILESSAYGKPVPGRAEPQVLVLCPTRELAQQVTADAIDLVKFCKGIRIATIMGGMPYGKQIAQVKGANLVVATPGRLLDLNDSRAIKLDKVKQLVVDEADRMLDLGFADDLEAIHARCTAREQTMMFSATFAPRIMELAAHLMNQPTRIELAHAGDVHTNITQTMHWADNLAHKHKILKHWLSDPSLDQAVVFASTQIESEEIADNLRANGFEASALHGAMPQAVRNRRLDSLRKGTTKILVATDVAARGIDVPTISHVINFGLPMKPEDYTHRIGRTGRAGRNGVAITIAEHRERIKIRAIERFTQQTLNPSVIPGLEPQSKPENAGRGRPGGGRPSGGRPGGRSGGGGRPNGGSGGRPSGGGSGSSARYAGNTGGGGDRGPARSNADHSATTPRNSDGPAKEKRYGKGQRSDDRSAAPTSEYKSAKPKTFGKFGKPRTHTASKPFAKPSGGFARGRSDKPTTRSS